ncbi:MAG: alcohol dehydrogenase catalytic domain-containing protein [Bacteroidales bacterium]|nr:alcohol dehydrogenase catalytic domain-containing protein [Bacteroidales bacterium]
MSIKSRAIVFNRPNEYSISTIDVPSPSSGQIRIKTLACGLCQREINVFQGRIERQFPVVMGHEPFGIVESIGENVEGFEIGDFVSGVGNNSLSEFSLLESRFSGKIVTQVTRPEFFIVEPIMCVVNAIKIANVNKNISVLVNGAGFMGNLLIQTLAKVSGCLNICAADVREESLVRAMNSGAQKAVFINGENEFYNFKKSFDIVFEVSGKYGTISMCTSLLRNGGTLCLFGHHFRIEEGIVNEWHLRGIYVLNTVPWAAPDLTAVVKDAIYYLNNRYFNLEPLISHTVNYLNFEYLISAATQSDNMNYTKGVVLF